MKPTGQYGVKCDYYWQVQDLYKIHGDDARLVAWPYVSGIFIVTINTYDEES